MQSKDLGKTLFPGYLQSGGEASIVAELVEVEENSTEKMQTIRSPPVITINKSAAYALYEITYIRVWKTRMDIPYW